MKKTAIFTRSIAMLFVFSLMLTALTGCGSKKAVTTDTVQSLAAEKGLQCVDVKQQFADYDFITEATVIAPDDFSYQMEFYTFSDSSQAQSFYANNKSNFEMNKGSVYTDSSLSGKNYARFTLNTNGKYMFIAYVDNTVFYVDVDQAYKSTVEEFIKAIDY